MAEFALVNTSNGSYKIKGDGAFTSKNMKLLLTVISVEHFRNLFFGCA